MFLPKCINAKGTSPSAPWIACRRWGKYSFHSVDEETRREAGTQSSVCVGLMPAWCFAALPSSGAWCSLNSDLLKDEGSWFPQSHKWIGDWVWESRMCQRLQKKVTLFTDQVERTNKKMGLKTWKEMRKGKPIGCDNVEGSDS